MGYDAVNIGWFDLTIGIDYLFTLRDQARFPFISSNLLDKKTNQPLFTPYTIKNINGYRVGIFGLLTPEASQKVKNVVIRDPIATAAEIVDGLKQETDFIICLSNLGIPGNKALCQAVPGINAVIGSGGETPLLSKPLVEKNAMILQAFQKGEYVGILEVLETKAANGAANRYQYRNVVVALDKTHPEHTDMQAMISEFKAQHIYP